MRSTRLRRVTASAVIGAVGITGVGLAATSASAAEHDLRAAGVSSTLVRGITSVQWQQIANAATAAGDSAAADAARAAAQGKIVAPEAMSFLVKQAIKAALKYGRKYLPAKIRPYADKLYNLIDLIENTAEISIFTLLVNAGIPPDLARYTAQWIVTFL